MTPAMGRRGPAGAHGDCAGTVPSLRDSRVFFPSDPALPCRAFTSHRYAARSCTVSVHRRRQDLVLTRTHKLSFHDSRGAARVELVPFPNTAMVKRYRYHFRPGAVVCV